MLAAADRMAMLLMAKGNTMAHDFIRTSLSSNINPDTVHYRLRRGEKIFIPSEKADRVIMFRDRSGAYVHEDGFITPMGEDISREVAAWTEVNIA